MDATPNLSLTQPAAPLFDRVPDELLLMILSFAMDTTTPCLFGRNGCFNPEYDGDDAKSCRTLFGENTQEAHRADWLAVNSISSRFRRVGMEAFFASKTFIITAGTLARLHAHVTGSELPTDGFYWNSNFDEDFEFYPYIEDWKRSKEFNFYFAERDLESVLRTIRHLCVIYVEIDWPSWWIELPTRLTIFPNLRYFAGCESLAFCPCGMAVMGDPAETEIDSRDTQLMRSFLVKNDKSDMCGD
ncbi:hypothetical protein CHU98_g4240 [Xylaria longipes]|nr:hypothetical protein CHU98_g4240 [Xylaria longipes]